MTQYNPQFPGYPIAQSPTPAGRRLFPFLAGYVLWFLPALWRDAGRRWRGVGFFYMLILLAVSWAVSMGSCHSSVAKFVHEKGPEFAKEIPSIDIKDGVVSTDVEEPYVIANPDTKKPFLVIDTTGETTEPPPEPPSMLLTRNALIVRTENKVQTIDLSEVKAYHLDSQTAQGYFDWLLSVYWSLWFPILVVISMFWRFLQMLLYGLIAMAVASTVRPPLKFSACMRLAALAVTPVIVIETIASALGFGPVLILSCGWFLLAIVLEIVLLIFMVRANNDPMASIPAPGGGYFPPTPIGGAAPYGYPPQGFPPQPPPQGYAQGYPPPPPPPAAPTPPTGGR
jgi:hypothetical protein